MSEGSQCRCMCPYRAQGVIRWFNEYWNEWNYTIWLLPSKHQRREDGFLWDLYQGRLKFEWPNIWLQTFAFLPLSADWLIVHTGNVLPGPLKAARNRCCDNKEEENFHKGAHTQYWYLWFRTRDSPTWFVCWLANISTQAKPKKICAKYAGFYT